MLGGLRARDWIEDGSIVAGSVTLAKVVGLCLRGVTAKELPINLVQIVRLHDNARDNASARSSNYLDLAVTKEEVARSLDSWSISLLVDDKVGAIGVKADAAGGCLPARGEGTRTDKVRVEG